MMFCKWPELKRMLYGMLSIIGTRLGTKWEGNIRPRLFRHQSSALLSLINASAKERSIS